MRRDPRPWILALTLSLLLHAALLGGVDWTLPGRYNDAAPMVLEARLTVAARPPAPRPEPLAPEPSPAPVAIVATPTPDDVVALPETEPSPEPEPVAIVATPAPDDAGALPEIEPVATAFAAPAENPAAPPLNSLPPRIDMNFDVRYGLAAGEQTLVWINEGERYTLTSVAAATGLTGLFYRGRFVQTSRGRITPEGLQPEEFWDQRGERRASVRFDRAAGRVAQVAGRGAPSHFAYRDGIQDALSLFFQFALTAPPPPGPLTYEVFNGKRVRAYSYETRGEVILDTALGPLRTLHLARAADADGHFEIWLAIDRHYLPVRLVRSDDKGGTMELTVRAIAP